MIIIIYFGVSKWDCLLVNSQTYGYGGPTGQYDPMGNEKS